MDEEQSMPTTCEIPTEEGIVILIIGARKSGKSSLLHVLLEKAHNEGRQVFIMGVPDRKLHLLPPWMIPVSDLYFIPDGAAVGVDESGLMFEAGNKKNAFLKRMMITARHHGLTLIFDSTLSSDMHVSIPRGSDVICVKKPSHVQHKMERREIRQFVEEALAEFKKLPADADPRKYVYISTDDCQGLITNGLPSYWSESLSKSQSTDANIQPQNVFPPQAPYHNPISPGSTMAVMLATRFLGASVRDLIVKPKTLERDLPIVLAITYTCDEMTEVGICRSAYGSTSPRKTRYQMKKLEHEFKTNLPHLEISQDGWFIHGLVNTQEIGITDYLGKPVYGRPPPPRKTRTIGEFVDIKTDKGVFRADNVELMTDGRGRHLYLSGKLIEIASVEELNTTVQQGATVVIYGEEGCPNCARAMKKINKMMLEHPMLKYAHVACEALGTVCDGKNIEDIPHYEVWLDGILKQSFSGITGAKKLLRSLL